jgi:hypothetical protein
MAAVLLGWVGIAAAQQAETNTASAPVRVSSGALAALLIKRIDPVYPASALAEHGSTLVAMHVIVSKTGDVKDVQPVSGSKLLLPIAMEAVKQWRYKPYLMNGEPVEVETVITIEYLFGAAAKESEAAVPSDTTPSELVERMLPWFPADTETLIGTTGPLPLPTMSQDANGMMSAAGSGDEVLDAFKQYSLLLLLPLSKNFGDEPILAAIEGSRDFRPPSGLGMAPFQGAAIAVFADDVSARADAFLKEPASTFVATKSIEGQTVAVFKQKSEEDIWTTYLTFPKPNIAVVATDEGYLREVLARIDGKAGDGKSGEGKTGERALPSTLPEWKYVDTHAQFWALRHFRQNGQSLTSGFSLLAPGITPNERAIGLAFSFDPGKSKTATVRFLSDDEDSLQSIQKNLFSHPEPGVAEMYAQYREVRANVLEGTYNLARVDSAEYFVFVLEALLGHAIFL